MGGMSDNVLSVAGVPGDNDDGARKLAALPEVVLLPGQRRLSNGAVYDDNVKRIVANPGGGTAAITQADASAKNRLRWERAQRAALSGLGSVAVSNKGSSLAAWHDINANMASYAMTERSIGAVKAAEFVGRTTGLLPDKDKAGAAPASGVTVTMSEDAFQALTVLLADMRAHNAGQDGDQDE